MPDGTLHIRIESPEQARSRVRDRLAAIEGGEDVEDRAVLILKSVDDLSRVFSPKNMELLKTIAEEQPESVRETARIVDRQPSEVSTNLNELESLGVVKFEKHGASKRPTVWYNELSIEVQLPDVDFGTGPNTRALT